MSNDERRRAQAHDHRCGQLQIPSVQQGAAANRQLRGKLRKEGRKGTGLFVCEGWRYDSEREREAERVETGRSVCMYYHNTTTTTTTTATNTVSSTRRGLTVGPKHHNWTGCQQKTRKAQRENAWKKRSRAIGEFSWTRDGGRIPTSTRFFTLFRSRREFLPSYPCIPPAQVTRTTRPDESPFPRPESFRRTRGETE